MPDLRYAASKPKRHKWNNNWTYTEFASHYGCAVLPVMTRKPKDRSQSGGADSAGRVLDFGDPSQAHVLSLAKVNAAIRGLLTRLDKKSFQELEGSRNSLFGTLDKPALRPFPQRPYEIGLSRSAKANIGYDVTEPRGPLPTSFLVSEPRKVPSPSLAGSPNCYTGQRS